MQPPENSYGDLIKDIIIIPFIYVMNREFQVAPCSIPLPDGDRLDFWDLEKSDRIMHKMEFKYTL
jgi:hypothetical protein